MRQSQLFTKTSKQTPKDETSKNAQLLIRAGFVHKEMAGVYSYLPLGLRVLNKINDIIREEMNKIGGVELHLTALQNPEIWQKTDRWSDEVVDNWFKTKLKNDSELGLAFTHEEPLTNLMKNHINSYKDLPAYPYQIQTKFRNELRSKSGIMRCREFLMKDLYSFSRTQTEHDEFYEKAKQAYKNIFNRIGLGDKTYFTAASGGVFSKFSHEFQVLSEAGEDIIYISKESDKGGWEINKNGKAAINREIFTDDLTKDLNIQGSFEEKKSIEVGNIFTLGTKFSEPLGLKYTNQDGQDKAVIMGSYGIGPGRVMGTIAEIYNDDNGLMWPKEVAPFDIHLISLCKDESDIKQADALYKKLKSEGKEVLYDERDTSAGAKFADSDLIGIPIRYVISPKTLEQGSVEIKKRNSDKVEMIKIEH